LTPTRNQTRIAHYVDEEDTASVLLPKESLTFDIAKEKSQFIQKAKQMSFGALPNLQKSPLNHIYLENNPRELMNELNQTKKEMEKFKELKQQIGSCVKRERLLRNQYRHGVLGINKTQNAIKKDHFYSSNDAMVRMQTEKEKIKVRHEKKLRVVNATSEQIDMCKNKDFIRKDDNIVDIFQQWKRKQVSPIRYKNTHESIFMPDKRTPKMERLQSLIRENTKGRRFNILTNGNNTPTNML